MGITKLLLMLSTILLVIIMLIIMLDKVTTNKRRAVEGKEIQLKEMEMFYNAYRMQPSERLFYVFIAATVIFLIGFVFYRSFILSLLITPLGLLYPRYKSKELLNDRKNKLTIQFKEALYALNSSLSAGKSIEMAFKDALKDLEILYDNPNVYIIKELQLIIRKVDMNETIEEALLNLSERSGVEEIRSFTDVFITCKRTGGNIVEVIKNTSKILGDKVSFQNDIRILLAQRKFEQKLLNIVPIVIILLLSNVAGDYMEPIFTTIIGRIIMSISIVLLVAAFFISSKIMDIEV